MSTLYKNLKKLTIEAIVNFFNAIGMKKNFSRTKHGSFLIISTTGIGDTIWGTPAIRALKETYPECYTGVLTNPSGFELLKENPNIDDLFIFKRGLDGFFSLPGLLKTLRQKKFEVALIFHASDRIVWPLAFFTGAGEIIGVNGSSKGLDFILTRPVTPSYKSHGVELRLDLVKQVGAIAKQKAIEIFLTANERKWADKFLKSRGIDESSLIVGLHPGAQKPYKCWPTDNFISLGNELVKKYNCSVIITGASAETELANMVSSQIHGAISVTGELTIRETAAIIEKMDIFITNDTGPMHIAFALKTTTIALFSPTDPELCGPYNALGKFKAIAKPKICEPCIGKKCDNPRCLEQITVEEVIAEAEYLLSK